MNGATFVLCYLLKHHKGSLLELDAATHNCDFGCFLPGLDQLVEIIKDLMKRGSIKERSAGVYVLTPVGRLEATRRKANLDAMHKHIS